MHREVANLRTICESQCGIFHRIIEFRGGHGLIYLNGDMQACFLLPFPAKGGASGGHEDVR